MQKKYSLQDIVKIVLKNIVVIIIFAIIGGLGFSGLAKYKNRVSSYSSERNVLIAHDLSDTTGSNRAALQTTDFKSVQTHMSLLKDRKFTEQARKLLSKKLRKEYSVEDLQHAVTFKSSPNSLVIEVLSEANSAANSAAITNAFSKAIKNELPNIVPDSGEVTLLAKAKKSDATVKTGPSIKKYLILGVALGTLVGMVIVFCKTTWKKILN